MLSKNKKEIKEFSKMIKIIVDTNKCHLCLEVYQ